MRPRIAVLMVASLVTGWMLSSSSSVVAAAATQKLVMWQQVEQVHFERFQAMVARGASRQAAFLARQRQAGVNGVGPYDEPNHVMQIAQDLTPPPPGGEADTQVEPDVAMNPSNPAQIVAVYQQGRFQDGASANPGFATSHDSGRTWTYGDLPNLTVTTGGEWDRASDAVVAWGPGGVVYANTLVLDEVGCGSGLAVQRSDDGGLSWNDPVVAQLDGCKDFSDKNFMTVDTFPGSPFYGRVYVTWDLNNPRLNAPTVVRFSDDEGETWSRIIRVTGKGTATIGVNPLVQPNGDLTLIYEDYTVGDAFYARTSHDGGVTFGPPVFIADWLGSSPPDMRTGGLLSATIDPVTGFQYVVWADTRFRNDGLNDILATHSEDGGQTWTAPFAINPDGDGSFLDHFTPDVAAWGHDVHVNYYTRDNTNGRSNLVDQRYIVSTDDGYDFGGELTLGPPSNIVFAAQVFFARIAFLGDYIGIAAGPGVVHPVWERSSRVEGGGKEPHQRSWSAIIEE